MRPIRPLPLVVVHGVLFLGPVHLDVGGVPVDRGRRQQLGPSPRRHQPEYPGVDHADAVLDTGQMCCGETLRQLRGGRRRRRGHRLQQLPGGIRAAPIHPDQEIRTGQLRRRHRQHQATRGQPPVTPLQPADGTVQGIGDAQNPIRLGHRSDSRVTGQPRIGHCDPDPTEPATADRTPR